MQRFKERLVARRNALGWSQVVLADKSGVSERSIAGYETTGKPATGTRLEKLAAALGVSPAWLIGGGDASMYPEVHSNASPMDDATNLAQEKTIALLRGHVQGLRKQIDDIESLLDQL